jgi:catechol 2,3-dioxygenase
LKPPVIKAIGHVALQTADLDSCLRSATEVLGLREIGRADGWVYLTHGTQHHALQYREADRSGLDHVGLVAEDGDAIDEIRDRLQNEEVEILADGDLGPGLGDGVAFTGPEGFAFAVYASMESAGAPQRAGGVLPRRFGHVTVLSSEPARLGDFLQRVLDFRISDVVGDGIFLRCNSDHHGLGVMPGERAVLHHHAWEVSNIVELGQLGDLLDELGQSLLWGPVRHGAGDNIAAYFHDPAGAVIEYYTDMERIEDEAGHRPGNWDPEDGHRWYSKWAPGIPPEMMDLGVPPAADFLAVPAASRNS